MNETRLAETEAVLERIRANQRRFEQTKRLRKRYQLCLENEPLFRQLGVEFTPLYRPRGILGWWLTRGF